jgi:hypothetical protein
LKNFQNRKYKQPHTSYHWLLWNHDFDMGKFQIQMGKWIMSLCDRSTGMLTPPRHLILPPVYPGVHVSPFISLTCNSYFCFETDHSLVTYPFHFGKICYKYMYTTCIEIVDLIVHVFVNGLISYQTHGFFMISIWENLKCQMS